MTKRYPIIGLALLAVIQCAAQPSSVKSPRMPPIATVLSSSGLMVNGVPTPPGVNSALVAQGDIIGTLDGQATMRFTDGRTVALSPLTAFQVSTRSGGPLVVSRNPIQSRLFALPPVSIHKP